MASKKQILKRVLSMASKNPILKRVVTAIAEAEIETVIIGLRLLVTPTLTDSKLDELAACMQSRGIPDSDFRLHLAAAFVKGFSARKARNIILPLLVLLVLLAILSFVALVNSSFYVVMPTYNLMLVLLLAYLIICAWILKGSRIRRMKKIWRGSGSVSDRLDRMFALSEDSPVAVRARPLIAMAPLAAVLIVSSFIPDATTRFTNTMNDAIFDLRYMSPERHDLPSAMKYREARSLMRSGEYAQAADLYKDLDYFMDNHQRLVQAALAAADGYMEEAFYPNAIYYYRQAGSNDQANAAAYAQAELSLQGKESIYLLIDGHWTRATGETDPDDFILSAINCFMAARGYSDAAERAKALILQLGEQTLAAGDTDLALEYFTMTDKYPEVTARAADIYRTKAEAYIADGETKLAAQQFILAGDTARAQEICDALCAEAIAAHDYETAVQLQTELGSEDALAAVRYQEAVWHYDSGNYVPAYLGLSKIPDYVPETGRSVSEYLKDEKIVAAAQETLWYTPGNFIIFGAYEQDNDLTNGAEPLEWIVLESDGSKSLLMSRYIIDRSRDSDLLTDSEVVLNGVNRSAYNWDVRKDRAWLNDDFISAAFTDAQQQALLTTEVRNDARTSYPNIGVSGGKATQDRVFLPSYEEIDRYQSVIINYYVPNVTAYAAEQGVKVILLHYGNALLRSIAADSLTKQRYPGVYGYNGSFLKQPEVSKCGLRPLVWVDVHAAVRP